MIPPTHARRKAKRCCSRFSWSFLWELWCSLFVMGGRSEKASPSDLSLFAASLSLIVLFGWRRKRNFTIAAAVGGWLSKRDSDIRRGRRGKNCQACPKRDIIGEAAGHARE